MARRCLLLSSVLSLALGCSDDASSAGTDGGSSGPGTTGTSGTPGSTGSMQTGSGSATAATSTDGTTDASTTAVTTGTDASTGDGSSETGDGPVCPGLDGDGAAVAVARLGDAAAAITTTTELADSVVGLDGAAVVAGSLGRAAIAVPPLEPIPAASTIAAVRAVMARVDSSGDYVWARVLESAQVGGASPYSNILDLAVDGDRVAFVGNARGAMMVDGEDSLDCFGRCGFFGWTSGDGTLTGPFALDGGPAEPPLVTRVAAMGDGSVVLGGANMGSVNFGGATLNNTTPGNDLNLAGFSEAGEHVWSRRWGGTGSESLGGLAAVDGDVVLVGTTNGQVDFGGDLLGDDGVGPIDVVVARLGGGDGDHVWSVGFEVSGDGASAGLTRVAAIDDTVVVTIASVVETTVQIGDDSATGSAFVVALDAADGSVRWHQTFEGDARVRGVDARCDAAIVTGSYLDTFTYDGTESPQAAGEDGFVVRIGLDDGALGWLQTMSDATQGVVSQEGHDVAFGPDDAAWWVGRFAGDIDLGTGLQQAGLGTPGADGFAVRITP